MHLTADTKVYGDFTNDFNKLTVNCGAGAEYFMMRNGLHVTDIDNLITGETYSFTVTITDAAKRLVEVNINGEALEAVDGVYSFVSAEGQTLNIVTDDKPSEKHCGPQGHRCGESRYYGFAPRRFL